MKVIFGIFLPICIFSFIAFGISVAVLGVKEIETPPEATNITGMMTELDGSYSNIELSSNTVNITLYPTDNNKTILCVPSELRNAISVNISDDTLELNCNRKFDNFDDFWAFITSDKTQEIEVFIPNKKYDEISASVNTGNTEINGISAVEVELELTAGQLIYVGNKNNRSEALNVDMSAGNCEIYNAATNVYNIEMTAGNIDVYGLTGSGDLDISAGNANINYAEYNGNLNMDLSAGNLTVNLPDDVSAEIVCDKSAGSMHIDYGNINEFLEDDDYAVLGDGTYHIYADLSAGNITITDKAKSKDAPAMLAPPVYDSTVTSVTTAIAQTVQSAPAEASVSIGDIINVEAAEDSVDVKVGNIEVSVDPVSVDVNI